MKGVDPRTVQEYLGHSTIQITEKYSHLSKNHKREAIKILSFACEVETKLKQIAQEGNQPIGNEGVSGVGSGTILELFWRL